MGQALSKRRRGKAGRKRVQGVARTKSGRISRSRKAREDRKRVETMEAEAFDRAHYEVRLVIRAAKHGLTEAQAARQESGTVLGRLWLSTQIDERQYDAGVNYRKLRADYLKAINAPDGTRNGPAPVNGDDTDAHEDWVADVKARFQAAQKAISGASCQNREANIPAAMEYIVVKDQELDHMVGDLRLGLNALVRHFRLDAARKSPHKGQ